MPALIPMQRTGARTTFRSRTPTFADRRTPSLTFKMLGSFEPRRPRNRSTVLSTWVRPYERTLLQAWQPQSTKWCHGLPDGHLHGACWQKRPPSRRHERRWPDRELCPLLATFLMLPRSRGAIGRVRATPGAFPTAGRRSDGPDGRVDGIPGAGKGLKGRACPPKRSESRVIPAVLAEIA